MIVVEGLDNTGKTTLVEKLRDKYELDHHPSIGNKHDRKVIRDQAWQWLLDDQKNPRVIVDRSRFISEYIYNPILQRRDLAFGQDEWFDMLKELFSRPQLIIFCQLPIPLIRKGFEERDQLPGVAEHLLELEWAYQKFMGFVWFMAEINPDIDIVHYDYRHEQTWTQVKREVEEYLVKVKEGV